MVPNQQYIDVEIDKLTNSIENIRTGDSFLTDILLVDKNDLKGVTKKPGWLFNWKAEFKQPDRDVYKLTITNNLSVIQGLVFLTERGDHVYMNLIESAPFNFTESFRRMQERYYNGKATSLDIRDTQNALLNANITVSDIQAEIIQSFMRLENLHGGLFTIQPVIFISQQKL